MAELKTNRGKGEKASRLCDKVCMNKKGYVWDKTKNTIDLIDYEV